MLLYTNYRRQNGLGQSRTVQRKRFAAVEASPFLSGGASLRHCINHTSACALADLRGPMPLPLGCLIPTYLEFVAEQSLHAS